MAVTGADALRMADEWGITADIDRKVADAPPLPDEVRRIWRAALRAQAERSASDTAPTRKGRPVITPSGPRLDDHLGSPADDDRESA